jgi:hypothetical protein
VGRAIGIGIGALGAYGLITALIDHNDATVPEADHAKARENADKTLKKIDWDKPIIAIDVPGTLWGMTKEMHESFERQVGADRGSLVKLEYPAAAHGMLDSVALGEETLRLVLEEIQRRDPEGTKYHVALQGESQGAWVINDTLAEHPFAKTVDRVGLYGLPGDAIHDGALAHDPRVRITNHPLDPISWKHLGPASLAATAPGFILGGDKRDIPAAIAMIALNPIHAALFGAGELSNRITGDYSTHPHVYTEHYAGEGMRWLLTGAPQRPDAPSASAR